MREEGCRLLVHRPIIRLGALRNATPAASKVLAEAIKTISQLRSVARKLYPKAGPVLKTKIEDLCAEEDSSLPVTKTSNAKKASAKMKASATKS